MLFGPCQVLARLCEFTFGAKAHPLYLARFAFALMLSDFMLLAIAGITAAPAALFYVRFGASNNALGRSIRHVYGAARSLARLNSFGRTDFHNARK